MDDPISQKNLKATSSRRRLMAISSSGGHWEQMMLLREAFEGYDVTYANTMAGLAESSGRGSALLLSDFNARTPLKAIMSSFRIIALVAHHRPAVAISTGAAPGLVALLAAKMIGAKTVWIDSVANSEKLSLSGRLAGCFVDIWLTQWEHLARQSPGPRFYGSVL